MKSNILLLCFATLLLTSFAQNNRTELISRKWLMIEMQMDGKKYPEEALARQRQNGLASILQCTYPHVCSRTYPKANPDQ
jgi:hypothetical protein